MMKKNNLFAVFFYFLTIIATTRIIFAEKHSYVTVAGYNIIQERHTMAENKTKDPAGIEETIIFQRLWSKKIFIFVVTTLCFVIGLVSMLHRPSTYKVDLQILFKAKDSEHMGNLFHYGNMDFTLYPKTGKIEKNDSLQFTPAEQELLWQYKNKISFDINYSKCSITLSGKTSDTLEFIKELETVGRLLQKNMTSLFETYSQREVNSLHVKQAEIQTTLEEDLRLLLELQKQYSNPKDIDTQIKVKLAEYEYASLCIAQFTKMEKLKQSEKQLNKMEIALSSPRTELSEIQLSKRSLLMRWLFFGFVGSCIWVLGSFQIQSLLKNRKG